MKEIEIIEKRKPREKHFLKENGLIVANLYDDDVHFLKNGKYEDIDNTLVEEEGYYTNTDNAYKVWFGKNPTRDLMQMESEEHYLNIKLKENDIFTLKQENTESKCVSGINYLNILENIDLDYKVLPRQVKENIVLHDRNVDVSKIKFEIDTNLQLKVNVDKSISALDEDKIIFHIDTPFMIDQNQNVSNSVYYNLDVIDNKYQLTLVVDEQWLHDEKTVYPVIIDPTITNYGQDNSVYDTYIFPGDSSVDRNSRAYLKVGVDKSNGVEMINRSLIKFELPTIGTGSQIIDAQLELKAYPDLLHNTEEVAKYGTDTVNIYRLTEDWNEESANWDQMSNKYDSRVEGTFQSTRMSYYDPDNNATILFTCATNLTNLVKKWYTDTPNYGIMLKLNNEIYRSDIIPAFFSKNNDSLGSNPKPLLTITYRNQNGLENYMNYISQNFVQGQVYHNNYNGNLTAIFNIGSTIQGKMPVNLQLVYNTNDVILKNNIGYGLGYRFNLNQTIKETIIDDRCYLEYVDTDGTIHYFLNQKVKFDEADGFITSTYENTYFDEDGLDLVIEKSNTQYILKDKNGNQMQFTISNGIGYLSEIKDVSDNTNIITYDKDHKITKVTDGNGTEIKIGYEANKISIISPDQTVTLNYNNDNLVSIVGLLGVTTFTYKNNLISSITDITGKKIVYEYYDQSPYRLKKVLEYGINNSLGNYYEVTYGFATTTIKDHKGMVKTTTFNNYGNSVSISSLKESLDVTNAYGMNIEYGETFNGVHTYTNKLLERQIPQKYVKNLLKDPSFEEMETDFIAGGNSHVVTSTDYARSGNRSLKVQTGNMEVQGAYREISISKGKYYTFSAYVKPLYQPLYIQLYYFDKNGQKITQNSDSIIPSDPYSTNGEFERYDVTIYYPIDATSNLFISFMEGSTYYIDDAQLEEGEVVNSYNIIENSDFSDGLSKWNLSAYDMMGEEVSTDDYFEIVNITDNQTALKVKMDPQISTGFSQIFNIKGKAGDVYNLSFWYKNEGLVGYEGMGAFTTNNIIFGFTPIGDIYNDSVYNKTLNPNEKEWQYFSYTFTAPWDFNGISVNFSQGQNANNFYITNLNVLEDVRSITYDYDENGNVILSKNLNNTSNIFNYDTNNQLIKITNSKGSNFTFEYDNSVTDRVIRGISGTGIANEVEYDSFGNPITTKIQNNGPVDNMTSGTYRIRLKGTDQDLRMIQAKLIFGTDNCGHDKWILEKVVDNNIDYFRIKHSIISNKYITVNENAVILSNNPSENSLFKFTKNDNGSYLLQNKTTNKYIKYDNNSLTLSELVENDANFEFYFESDTNGEFIENNAKYSEDGKVIVSTTDTNFHCTTYDVDSTTGLINSMTNANGQKTDYNYNNKKQLTSIITGQKELRYEYNDQNGLSKIIQGDRTYSLNYNEFLNMESVKIGDQVTLITNNYEDNNGNLVSSVYGNNHTISYEYDEFDRIKKLIKMNDEYHYKYDNNGNLAKIISNNDIAKYIYDSGKRLYEYNFNQFKIRYIYDSDNNVVEKMYTLPGIRHSIQNVLNDDNQIINVKLDDSEINYNYDTLGRLSNSSINNYYTTNYKYVTNGKRTSLLIKSINNNGDDKYSYTYDKLDNITHIYHNDILENKYYYNEYNELIKEDNYLLNQTIEYEYDLLGNLLSTQVYQLNTKNLLMQNKYNYNNINWKDQLTEFNQNIITYDEIGNPLTIGENITLDWINGRQLNNYTDANNTISYKYNKEGIRLSKIVNGIKTEFYVEGNKIILEKTGNNVIYYLRDNVNNLIGFKYNNSMYYYVKNAQGDIIKILDDNYNVVSQYEYDSWGNILTISDENGNDVSLNDSHIANINPFRYRSYYYDKETKWYYLNNRYYNPEWHRFINTDSLLIQSINLSSNNLYAYAMNNPINQFDPNGNLFKKLRDAWNCWKNGMSIIGEQVKNTWKSVTKTAGDFWNKVKDAFVFEGGVGVGVGTKAQVGPLEAGITANKTYNIGVSNGEGYNSTTTRAGFDVGVKNTEYNIGFSAEITHINEEIGTGNWEHNNPMVMPWEVWDCPNTKKTAILFTEFYECGSIEQDTDGGTFIGISIDAYLLVGGHVKIGFEL